MPLGFGKSLLTKTASAAGGVELGYYAQSGAPNTNNEAAKKITGLANHTERAYTFACWFRAVDSDFDPDFNACEPMRNGPGGGSGDYQGVLVVDFHKDNGIQAIMFGLSQGGGTSFTTGNLSNTFNSTYVDGEWHHLFVQARFGTSTSESKIYLDGVDKTTNALGSTETLHPTATFGTQVSFFGRDGSVQRETSMDIAQIYYEYGSTTNNLSNIDRFYDNGPVDMGTDGTGAGADAPEVFIYVDSTPAVLQGGSVGSIANTSANAFTVSATGGPS